MVHIFVADDRSEETTFYSGGNQMWVDQSVRTPSEISGWTPFSLLFQKGSVHCGRTTCDFYQSGSTTAYGPLLKFRGGHPFYYDFSRGPYALIDPHLIFTWAESGLLASLVARKYVFHYFCPTLYTNLGHKVANFECHDIPLFCPSGPPIFCPTATSAEITERAKTLKLRKFNFSREETFVRPFEHIGFSFFVYTLQLKSP